MEERRGIQADQPMPLCDGNEKYRVLIAVPILSEGDVLGSVAFVSDHLYYPQDLEGYSSSSAGFLWGLEYISESCCQLGRNVLQ